ncbi:acyl-CoA carboxylase subunit beta [Roseicella aquatilis]|uniref:Acyl-CoA carboxylase n=1 Tax=Roseicella aquatilis TaxID=2527868 RepID=A0A4R4DVU5_9PROT|nr:carboxyl transferase domain-containing protein [Roseicella aquatilis]TCZ64801.1 acyl-CoA carboxylase [Roseicella aquatilis]
MAGRDALRMVEAARAALGDEARGAALARQRGRGKLTARERVAALLDSGSFMEVGGFATAEPDGEAGRRDGPADGVVTGTGRIDGRAVVVVAQDFSVAGGSIGRLGTTKTVHAVETATGRGLPLVMLLDGGGHRIQDGQDARSFAHASPLIRTLARASGWVPLVALMLGPGFAGPTNFAGLSDFVVMVRGLSAMGMAGPALVKAATGEEVSQEELGGAEAQAHRHGLADLAVESEAEALAAARRFLSYLPANARAPLPVLACDDPADRREEALLTLVPESRRKGFDVRLAVAGIADTGSVFELKPRHAGNMVTALARLDGRPVGILANQSLRLGGIIDAAAAEKGARFIAFCDAYGIPLVSLIDVPGFLIGPGAERSGLGRRSARLPFEWAHASVPRISVVLRKGYGLGYIAMAGGRSMGADAAFAWPGAEICAMSIEGSVDVAYRRDYEAAEDPAARRQALIEGIRARTGALRAAEGFGVDDVIDPRDTRARLIEVLRQVEGRQHGSLPPKKRAIPPI